MSKKATRIPVEFGGVKYALVEIYEEGKLIQHYLEKSDDPV